MINFPDYKYFDNLDVLYVDFIQRITPVINETVSFKKIRIKNYSQD